LLLPDAKLKSWPSVEKFRKNIARIDGPSNFLIPTCFVNTRPGFPLGQMIFQEVGQ
jgi:hypothetical protein